MPTTTSGRKVNTREYWERSSTTLQWRKVSTDTWEYNERTLTVPTTTKRSFPKTDLYLNGTGRTVTSVIRRDSGFDYEVATSPRNRWINTSVYSAFYDGDITLPTPSIDTTAMYNKIRGEVRGEATNLAQMLAEYRQTAQLFVDLTKAFLTKGRSLLRQSGHRRWYQHHGNRRNDPSKTLGSAYLQWTYGVSPLMSDMHSAMNELTNRLNIPVYIGGVETRKASSRGKGVTGIGSTLSQLKADWEGLRVRRHRCQWRAYISQNQIKNVLVSHGFGNPLAIAWELVPFSFVVDWWVNVGEVLQSLDNMLLIDKLVVLESTSDRTLIMTQTRPDSLLLKPGSNTSYRRTDTRKVPVQISKVASLRYKPSVSAKHIMNGLALLTQFRR